MITMSAKKLWVLAVVSVLAAACSCGAEDAGGRKTAADEEQVYKNHRTSKNNETTTPAWHKYPVYPAQVYANLSNARDFTTAKTEVQAARTTEAPPADVVRVFITSAPGAANKRTNKPDGRTTSASSAQQQQQQRISAAPSVYFVTSKSVQSAESSTPPALKSPVYSSSPSPQGTGSGADGTTRETTVTADEPNRKLKFNNGTKIRRVLKAQQRLKQAGQLYNQQQQQQPTVLLSATSTAAPPVSQSWAPQLQAFVGTAYAAAPQSRNVTAAAPAAPAAYAKVANSSGPSKPFATVLVPKQMLEGNGPMVQSPQDYSSSFRPIAAPVQYASYRPSAVDTNAVADNRRMSTEAKTQTGAAKAHTAAAKVKTGSAKAQAGANKVQAGASGVPKLTKYGFVKPPTYKVEEYVSGDGAAAAAEYDKRFNGNGGHKNDRSDQTVFVPAERRGSQEKPVRVQQLESALAVAAVQRYDQQQQQQQKQKQQQLQFREYYPATEVTPTKEAAAAPYIPYDAAGKFDMRPVAVVAAPPFVMNTLPAPGLTFEVNGGRPAPGPFELNNRQSFEMVDSKPPFEPNGRPSFEPSGRPSFEPSDKPSFEPNSRPSFEVNSRPSFETDSRPSFELNSRPSPSGPPKGAESSTAPEVVLGDVNPKDVLKSLLLDIFKGKELQSETTGKTSKPSAADETVDSFFKVNRPNVDFGVDNYDIDTDMSCNLRSTKYITDGQCVTTKPVVEAVCADRCLVYASSTSLFGVQRQRSSPTANQQVEALHCVNGDSKLVRVQLHCRDGNTLNNIIKVVTNCRCKLHQIQPQMRSNSQSLQQGMGMPNPDIMSIAAGTF